MADTRLTMLNLMADGDFERSLARHREWNITELDLKDHIFGSAVLDLDDSQLARAADMIAAAGLRVWCLSTPLFHDDVERGEAHFRGAHLARVARGIKIADVLRPRFVRLLSATSSRRGQFANCVEYLDMAHPWLIEAYREAIDRIADAGHGVTIENEVGPNLLAGPDETLDFFSMLARRGRVVFTWDIVNLWQVSGRLPTVETYEKLRPIIGYLHLKGGRSADGSDALATKSMLADASWPVLEIVRAAVADEVSEVICLNPPHGKAPVDWNPAAAVESDIAFLRSNVDRIA